MKELIATYNSPVVYRVRPFLKPTALSESVKERICKHFDALDLRSNADVEEWLGTIFTSTRFYACSLIREITPFDPYTMTPEAWAKQFDVVADDEERNWVEGATVLFVSRMTGTIPEIALDHPDFLKLPSTLALQLAPLMHEIYPHVRETLIKAMLKQVQCYGKTADGQGLQKDLWPLNHNACIDGQPLYVLR